ncbi:hypothetical protein BGZ65_004279, partial [Modicella reniformis]
RQFLKEKLKALKAHVTTEQVVRIPKRILSGADRLDYEVQVKGDCEHERTCPPCSCLWPGEDEDEDGETAPVKANLKKIYYWAIRSLISMTLNRVLRMTSRTTWV